MKMRSAVFVLVVLCFALAGAPVALANCADDAINTCNGKHPNPNESDNAFGLYELCIKAQLDSNCPNDAAGNNALVTKVQTARLGVPPRCPARHVLRVNWRGDEDRCVKSVPLRVKRTPDSKRVKKNEGAATGNR